LTKKPHPTLVCQNIWVQHRNNQETRKALRICCLYR